jgi:hypothetical protein
MKRCPLCEFIYEDDQSVCDMDGIELVLNSGALVLAGKDRNLRPPAAVSSRRRRSLLLLLGFGLGAAVFSAYYTSVDQAAPTGGGQTSATYTRPPATAFEPTPVPGAAALATPPAETSTSPTEVATPTPAASAPQTQPRAASPGGKRSRPGNVNRKKESKLSSLLHKTGRILKKPFGF